MQKELSPNRPWLGRRHVWGGMPQAQRGKLFRFLAVTVPQPPKAGVQEEDLDEQEKIRRLEAVLLLSPEGISSRKAAKLAGLADATEARTLIRKLNLIYDSDG